MCLWLSKDVIFWFYVKFDALAGWFINRCIGYCVGRGVGYEVDSCVGDEGCEIFDLEVGGKVVSMIMAKIISIS